METNKSSRTYNSKKNVFYGFLVTILNTLVAFVNRTFFVKCLGLEYLGLNGLFTEVVTMLSLAELGVGMAINYSLYKPIHDNDYRKINQLMALFRKTYNLISIVILVLGIIILPFIHIIVKGTSFDLAYIRLVFLLFVINTSVSYLFSYNTSFITADQKQYIVSLTTSVFKIVFTVIAIIILVFTKSFVLYLVLLILQTFLTNVYLTYYVKSHYSFINFSDKLPVEERNRVFKDIKNIFIKRVSGVITSSTTNVLISALINTIQVGFYSNYLMIFSVIRTLNKQFSNGIKASLGDVSVSEAPNNCILILRRLTFLFFGFSLVVCSGLVALCSDFITIWIGSEYVMKDSIVLVAVVILFIEICSEPLWQYLEVSGLFKQDRNIAIIASVINLAVAIICGFQWGMIGILLGTLSTQIIQIIFKSRLLFNNRFYFSSKGYLLFWAKIFFSFAIVIVAQLLLNRCLHFDNWLVSFIIKGIAATFFAIAALLLVFWKTPEFKYSICLFKNIIKKQ